jgi:hypothetical protein
MFISEDEVDDDDDELESARERRCEWDGIGAVSATAAEAETAAAAAAAAASCSLECRRSARLRRELSGLRRRGSRIILDRSKTASRLLHGPVIGFGWDSVYSRDVQRGFNQFEMRFRVAWCS